MPRDFIPSREAELVTWAENFATLLTAAPTDYGVTLEQAAACAALFGAFDMAYTAANNPATRSRVTVVTKNAAKDAMVADIRALARIIQASPLVNDTLRAQLGLTVRDPDPSPIPVPAEAPEMDILSVSGYTVRVRLHGVDLPGRAKPEGVEGAVVVSYVGQSPPQDINLWTFQGNTTRTTLDVTFPDDVAPGTTVWLRAFWYNPKAQAGPASPAMSTYLQIGNLPQAA